MGVAVVLDSEGEPLRLGTRAEPTRDLAERARGRGAGAAHEFADDEDRVTGVHEMVELGAREAIMTLRTGCIALLGDEHERTLVSAHLDPDEPVSKVGSGDAFLAGYVAARYTGRTPEDCVRFAVACGAESTKHFGAGVLDPREAERLAGEVEVSHLARQQPANSGNRLFGAADMRC